MGDIDFILPWVDDSDPVWLEQKGKYGHILYAKDNSNAPCRFREYDTLKYALRSIETNCPWYHRIYLITASQVPNWLNIEHPNIQLIPHQQLFYNHGHLPTFSSRSIEMNLPNLADVISKKFVYLNDDFLIVRPLKPTRFFIDDKPVDFFSHGWVPRNALFELVFGKDNWISALKNNLSLINKQYYPFHLSKETLFSKNYPVKTLISNFLFKYFYRKIFWLEHWHHPQPYLTRTLTQTFKEFKDQMLTCSQNRFRSHEDLTPYLYRYQQLVTENFIPIKHDDGLVFQMTSLKKVRRKLKEIRRRSDINFVCFNDSHKLDEREFNQVKTELVNYMESVFPKPASFEKKW